MISERAMCDDLVSPHQVAPRRRSNGRYLPLRCLTTTTGGMGTSRPGPACYIQGRDSVCERERKRQCRSMAQVSLRRPGDKLIRFVCHPFTPKSVCAFQSPHIRAFPRTSFETHREA